MRRKLALALALIAIQLCLLAAASPESAQTSLRISTAEEIRAEFDSVPCKNEERLAAARALFEKMGAPPASIKIEKYGGVENLVVRKEGASQEKVVIGAHYDKVTDGCGAIDNWTGVVTIAHIYRTLKDVPLKKSLIFVAFGKEEKGLVGSHAMVWAIPRGELAQYCAMVNIDSLGLAAPQVADNMSSDKLEKLTADLAKQMKIPFSHASIAGADADSSSFIAKGIPAITIHGLTDNWMEILHSPNDQPKKLNTASLYLGYRLALALTARVSESPCAAYR